MTAFSMILAFILMIMGGYGFSSTKVASLNIPLMQKIEPVVESWAFLHPFLLGLTLFVFAMLNVVESYKVKSLQVALAVSTVFVFVNTPDVLLCIRHISANSRPPLEFLLRAETAIVALIFLVRGFLFLRTVKLAEPAKP